MKLLKTTALFALLFICSLSVTAQNSTPPLNEPDYNKPKFFSDLPDKLSLNITAVELLLNLPKGAAVNKSVAAGFHLNGAVISKADDGTLLSIVIKGTARGGAAFTFTRFKNAEGNYSYTGRMFGKNSSDAVIIEKEGTGYVLRKKSYYDVVAE